VKRAESIVVLLLTLASVCFVAGVWGARPKTRATQLLPAADRARFAQFCLIGGWIFGINPLTILGLLIFPILWAVCFGTFAVLSTDSMFPGNNGDVINSVLAPLVTLAALIIAFRLPFAVLSQGMKAGISPGISRGVSHVRNAGYVRSIAKVR